MFSLKSVQSTTSLNVFTKNTDLSIVKLCQQLNSFGARCQTLIWPPDCHVSISELVFLVCWPFLIPRRTAVQSSWILFISQAYKRLSRCERGKRCQAQWVKRTECGENAPVKVELGRAGAPRGAACSPLCFCHRASNAGPAVTRQDLPSGDGTRPFS